MCVEISLGLQVPGPHLGRGLCASLQVPIEHLIIGSQLLSEYRRAEEERQEALGSFRLCKDSARTILRWLDMELMRASNGENRWALP